MTREISKIIGLDNPLDPMMFLLGNIPKKKYSEEQRYILKILLLVTKKKERDEKVSNNNTVCAEIEAGLHDGTDDGTSSTENEHFHSKVDTI